MKKRDIKRTVVITMLLLCMAVVPVLAYFTANAKAGGELSLTFGTVTELKEEVEDFVKSVKIANTGDEQSEPVWVRVRAYSGSTYPLEIEGEGWTAESDGWYYYESPIAPGEETKVLRVAVTGIPEADAEDHEYAQINVAVVYETVAVMYAADGSYLDANWTRPLDTGTVEP